MTTHRYRVTKINSTRLVGVAELTSDVTLMRLVPAGEQNDGPMRMTLSNIFGRHEFRTGDVYEFSFKVESAT